MLALSFPDFAVLGFSVDDSTHVATIQMEGAWLDIDGGRPLRKGKLLLEGWSRAWARSYDGRDWTELTNPTDEPLKDICEAEFGPLVVLRGFGASSGQWTEVVFEGGIACYSLDPPAR